MWKTSNLSSYPIKNSHDVWKRFPLNYEIHLWTDDQIEKLISTAEYQYLYPVYKSYLYSIQRCDLARLVVLHAFGGIYADLDVYPHEKHIEKLVFNNASFIIGRSSTDDIVVNHFMISEKYSTIVEKILRSYPRKTLLNTIYLVPYLEVFSTGSIFLTSILRKLGQTEGLMILSKDDLAEYIYHDAGRSWHFLDGRFFNQFDADPLTAVTTIFAVVVVCFLIASIFFFIKYYRTFRAL
ncbi:unnamed protein product [Adineta ricciae]|uniref:Uncharacterized protein n=1 Tax=Adineta ricciae TaxID=249248 RepID=A0A815YX69_ADIRI|nr:unnamed protein product [Adineta ricciae]